MKALFPNALHCYVNFDLQVKLLLNISTVYGNYFLLAIKKQFMGEQFGICKYSVSHRTFLLAFSIFWRLLPKTIWSFMGAKRVFPNSLFSPHLSVGISWEESSFIFHLFNFLFIYYLSICIHGFLFYSLCYNPLRFLILDADFVPDAYDKSPFKLASLSF